MKTIGPYVFYSSGETSKFLGVNLRTLQRWIEAQKNKPHEEPELKAYKTINGRILFKREDVANFLKKRLGMELSDEQEFACLGYSLARPRVREKTENR